MSKRTITLGPADLEENELRGYEVGRHNVCVARIEGTYKAIDDWCNHAGCLLSGGHLEGNQVVCPCHDVGFNMDTGRNETSPSVCGDQAAMKISLVEGQLVLEDFDPEG